MNAIVDELEKSLREIQPDLLDDANYRRIAHVVVQRLIYLTEHNAGSLFVSHYTDLCRLLPYNATAILLGYGDREALRLLKDPVQLRQLFIINDWDPPEYRIAFQQLRGFPGRVVQLRLHPTDAFDLFEDGKADMVFSLKPGFHVGDWVEKVRRGGVVAAMGDVEASDGLRAELEDAGLHVHNVRATRNEDLRPWWFGVKVRKSR